MKLIPLLLLAILLQSCGSNASRNVSNASANQSALYDPPTVTLLPDKVYQFQEGTLAGRLQKLHSDYSYRRAIIIGNANEEP